MVHLIGIKFDRKIYNINTVRSELTKWTKHHNIILIDQYYIWYKNVPINDPFDVYIKNGIYFLMSHV